MNESVVSEETSRQQFVENLDNVIFVLKAIQKPYNFNFGDLRPEEARALSMALEHGLKELAKALGVVNNQRDISYLIRNLHTGAAKPHLAELYLEAAILELTDILDEARRGIL